MADADLSLHPLALAFLERLPRQKAPDKQLHRRDDGRVVGDWVGLELSSAFQPIVNAEGRVVGHEAFLRSASDDDQGLSPWTLFSTATDDTRLIALDRLARTLHLLNALVVGNTLPLFLNVHGRLLAAVGDDHGRAFRRVVDALGVRPEHIVIETPVEASAQPDLLAFVLRNYRNNGFRVAVNVASAAQWQDIASAIHPHFVKIDSRKLGRGPEAHERLKWLSALREDATLIVTHIENASTDYQVGQSLQQGYAFGRPTAAPAQRSSVPSR
ncbi:MAG: EAL domain-containing protein [Zoogloea sp.]|uniref:EAL domain-containing protein n=1 Tax=Zoogloea sp. TaxID=49181 RepID=UPI002629685E|nr:EAL domain-containing protein [Zoogloea sp.]MDD2989969.1 EAL domain-containing protein [Zoogloea sp.]